MKFYSFSKQIPTKISCSKTKTRIC